jgi:hypothetical protein
MSVHASDAELGPDLLPAHPLIRGRRTLVLEGVDAGQELPMRLACLPEPSRHQGPA